jgi:hypothetical protein
MYNTYTIHIENTFQIQQLLVFLKNFVFLKICGFFVSLGFILNFDILWILWEDFFVDMVKREGKQIIEVFVICCFMSMLKE